jgi:DNA-binding NtrC family response regulator
VIDDDRAVLTLEGTGVTCLDVLRALRDASPRCKAVLTAGYESLDAAVYALQHGASHGAGSGEMGSRPGDESSQAPPTLLADVERNHIVRTLEQVRGKKAVAARMLGMSRRTFYRQLERHGLHQRVPMIRCDATDV